MQKPITIGVAGGTGSGKTTIAIKVLERVGADQIAFLTHDSYYKNLDNIPLSDRHRINFDHPDSLDTPLLIENIRDLLQGNDAQCPVYDFTTHTRTDEVRVVQPQPIILVEGILIFSEPELRKLLDIKIFVDAAPDVRFIRRIQRDISERQRTMESVIEQYLATVRPMHLEFVEPSKRYADIIIPTGGYNDIAIDMVADRIRTVLQQ